MAPEASMLHQYGKGFNVRLTPLNAAELVCLAAALETAGLEPMVPSPGSPVVVARGNAKRKVRV
jgi:hypothetical protein